MISKFKINSMVLLALATVWVLTASLVPYQLLAEDKKIEVISPDALKSALTQLTGKQVTLRLKAGDELSGVLEAVGPSAIRLGQLTGKEFYSAVISIEGVVGVVYRAS